MQLTADAMRRLILVAVATATLALSSLVALPARAQPSGYAAEIAMIDIAGRWVTLKASMGQQAMRVASGVPLQAFKPGDKVLVTFGQEGNESVIARLEKIKPRADTE